MKQFLLPDNYSGEKNFTLSREDSHYLKNVLRYKEGNFFIAADIKGGKWTAVITAAEGKKVVLELKKRNSGDESIASSYAGDDEDGDGGLKKTNSSDFLNGIDKIKKSSVPEIVLCQCLPKGKKMDLIVRQAVEAGISEIQPLISEFSIVKYDSKSWKSKHERYVKIAREAFQQSGSRKLPLINKPVPLTSIKTGEKREIGLFFHQKSIENISLHKYLFTVPEKIMLIIGPEGGLSEKEVSYLLENNFKPVYLGENVLRTETAALYAAAAVKTIILERESWKTV